MDQLFINERELPLPPIPSPQPSDSSRDFESPSVRKGKAPEAPSDTTEGNTYQPLLGNGAAPDERQQQEHSSDAEPLSVQQGKAPEVSTPSATEEVHGLWDGNQETAEETQRKIQEERLIWEQYVPNYTEEQERILKKRLGVAEQVVVSQASGESSSRAQGLYGSSPGQNPSTPDIYGSGGEGESRRRDRSLSNIHVEDSSESNRPVMPRRYSRPSRPYAAYSGSSSREGSNTGGNSARLPSQIFRGPLPQTEVVVPRWQPDAEVTFCPICRTQFSFFVRKHHCRKCGRVVCNACSPHRITIPHQYIVHPPEDPVSLATRPSLDPARAGSSSSITSPLGGGERVRLCNPCVPDPNIAPPQTRSDGQPFSPPGHGRSVSSVPYTQSRRGGMDIPNYRQPKESNLSAEARHIRSLAWAASQQGIQQQQISSSYSQRDESLRPELEARSRSSTVGATREGNLSIGNSRQESTGSYSRPYNPLVPRSDINLSRPLPDTPQQHQRSTRRVIREEDQCWVCFRELPSRDLPSFQDLRDAHVMSCLEAATRRNSPAPRNSPVPPPPPPPRSSRPVSSFEYSNIRPQANAGASSSSTAPPPPPSTPESRMLARERQHAAVVLGLAPSGSSSSASPMSRVIPYIASEKDGIDDAECMVCLEDFEVGQEMGRLECFCRFHLKCIKDWFEKKPGKCPVHGVDG